MAKTMFTFSINSFEIFWAIIERLYRIKPHTDCACAQSPGQFKNILAWLVARLMNFYIDTLQINNWCIGFN